MFQHQSYGKGHPQSLLQVVTSKTGRMMATSKFKEGVVFLGLAINIHHFFLMTPPAPNIL
jgi:hypothetical protein